MTKEVVGLSTLVIMPPRDFRVADLENVLFNFV